MLSRNLHYVYNLKKLPKNVDLELIGRESMVYSLLNQSNLPVQEAFVVASIAFDDFLIATDIVGQITKILKKVRPFIKQTARDAADEIANIILNTKYPPMLEREIIEMYKSLNSYSEAPLVTLHNSQVMPDDIIPSSAREDRDVFVNGADSLLYEIKLKWLSLFSTEAIELRANSYYSGAVSVAIIIQKSSKSELSVASFSNYQTQNSQEQLVSVKALYGLQDINFGDDIYNDTYVYDVSDNTIVEKHIKPQIYMYVRKGKYIVGDNPNVQVEISDSWQRKQKLKDDFIKLISEHTHKIAKSIRGSVKLNWSIESGRLILTKLGIFSNNQFEISQRNSDTREEKSVQKLMETKVVEPVKKNVQKPNIKKLTEEVKLMLDNKPADQEEEEEDYFEYSESLSKAKSLTSKKPRLNIKENTERNIFKKLSDVELDAELVLDTSNLDPAKLNLVSRFDKGYIDGTSLFLTEGYLPEQFVTNAAKLGQISGNLGLQIATKAKMFQESQFIYSLSNISDFEIEKLYPKDKSLNILSGDERFIFSKEALYAELLGVKRAVKYYECENISYSIPSLRNYENFKKIMESIDGFGIFHDSEVPVYAEISIPSLLFSINQFAENEVSGFIVDYDILIRLSVNREILRNSDHEVAYQQVKIAAENANRLGIPLYVKMVELNRDVIENLKKLSPKGFIFPTLPNEEIIEVLKI